MVCSVISGASFHRCVSSACLECRAWNELQYSYLIGFLTNGTFERRDAILAETDFVNRATSDTDPYDQYEFSIPLQTVGDCIQTVRACQPGSCSPFSGSYDA